MNHSAHSAPVARVALPFESADDRPVVLDRRDGPYGEAVLRRHGELLQIIANGCFLMDTSDGRSERLLVQAALDALHDGAARTGPGPSLLIGGLGVGFSLAAAANSATWGGITVVEREPAVLDWHRDGQPLAPYSAAARADRRTRLVEADLLEWLGRPGDRYDAICLDIDNGPDWTVTEDNDGLYAPGGLALAHRRLTERGVLAVWSAQPSAAFETALRGAGFHDVRTAEVPMERGAPDVIHLARRTP